MRNMVRTIQGACFLGVGVLSGCANLLQLAPDPAMPFLLADPADVQLIVSLTQEQDTRVEHCQARKSCPSDHYLRGLLGLFHSREQAVASFQQVKSEAPDSRVAARSTSWITLLQARGEASKITEDFLWEVLAREFNEADETIRRMFTERDQRVGALTDTRAATSQDQVSIDKDQATIQALQRRLHERARIIAKRDKQIEALSSQLEALKRIDQDTSNGRRPVHSLTIGAP